MNRWWYKTNLRLQIVSRRFRLYIMPHLVGIQMNLIYALAFFVGFSCNLLDISFDFYNISIKFKYRQWIYIAYVSWSKIAVVYVNVNRIMKNNINVLLHLIVYKKNVLIEMEIHTKHIIKIINKNKKEARKTNLVCSWELSYCKR